MTLAWASIAVLAGSVLLARWQYSKTRAFWMYLWYQHWRMRERQWAWSVAMYGRYPRLMHWWHRVRMPYYRIRNSDRAWEIRYQLGRYWSWYAELFVPVCAIHKTALQAGECHMCLFDRVLQRHKLGRLTGKS